MNKSRFIFFGILAFFPSFQGICQNTYDSTYNSIDILSFDKNGSLRGRESLQVYKGQSLIIRDAYYLDYKTFLKDYTRDKKSNNIFKRKDPSSLISSKESLANKIAYIEDVINNNSSTFLRLKIDNEICYYEYPSFIASDFDRLFIVKGLYDKLIEMFKGKSFYIKSGGDTPWECFDISIIPGDKDMFGDLILLTLKKEGEKNRVLFYKANIKDERYRRFLITESDYLELKEKFGELFLNSVMNSKVEIGMSKEMVIMAIGNPDDKNKTTTANGVNEQWVYDLLKKYIYFDNGTVTAIQD